MDWLIAYHILLKACFDFQLTSRHLPLPSTTLWTRDWVVSVHNISAGVYFCRPYIQAIVPVISHGWWNLLVIVLKQSYYLLRTWKCSQTRKLLEKSTILLWPSERALNRAGTLMEKGLYLNLILAKLKISIVYFTIQRCNMGARRCIWRFTLSSQFVWCCKMQVRVW